MATFTITKDVNFVLGGFEFNIAQGTVSAPDDLVDEIYRLIGPALSTASIVYDRAGGNTLNGVTVAGVPSGSGVILTALSSSSAAWAAPAAPTMATPAIVLGSAAAAGVATTPIRSDSTIAAFDATAPVTQAFGDAAATGSVAFAARRDHKHGMPTGGSDLVQTKAGAGSVYIPGLRGSSDRLPASPGASDDEFEALSGWTTLGTLDTNNVSDVPSQWHGKRTLSGASIAGIYKSSPSMPFTVTARLGPAVTSVDNQFVGLMVLESAPGKATTFAMVRNGVATFTCAMYRWTTASAFASSANGNNYSWHENKAPVFHYVRLVVASSTDVTMQVSEDGYFWRTTGIANQNPSLTIANVGLVIGDVAGASTVEGTADWIRFT